VLPRIVTSFFLLAVSGADSEVDGLPRTPSFFFLRTAFFSLPSFFGSRRHATCPPARRHPSPPHRFPPDHRFRIGPPSHVDRLVLALWAFLFLPPPFRLQDKRQPSRQPKNLSAFPPFGISSPRVGPSMYSLLLFLVNPSFVGMRNSGGRHFFPVENLIGTIFSFSPGRIPPFAQGVLSVRSFVRPPPFSSGVSGTN